MTFTAANYYIPQVVTITGVDDKLVNSPAGTGTLDLQIRHTVSGNSTNYNQSNRGFNTFNVYVADGDQKGTVTLSDAAAVEGTPSPSPPPSTSRCRAGSPSPPPTTAGTAQKDSDYTENTTAISFSGTAGEKKTFTVSTVEDTTKESTETFTVGLSTTHSKVTTTDTGTATITDDDGPAVTLSVSASAVTVAENGAAETVTVTATTANSATFPENKTIQVAVGGGTAMEGTDYSTVNDFNIALASGSTSATGTFTLTPINDTIVEGTETLSVSGTATGLAVASATISITDDESASATLSATPSKVRERDGATTVTVKATVAGGFFTADQTVTVAVGKSGDTASEGTDYNTVNNFDLQVKSGYSSATGTFTLTPKSDSTAEGAESISVTGSNSAFTVTGASMSIDDTTPRPP